MIRWTTYHTVSSITLVSVRIVHMRVCALDAVRQDNHDNGLCKPTAVSQPRLEGRDGADDKLKCMRDLEDKQPENRQGLLGTMARWSLTVLWGNDKIGLKYSTCKMKTYVVFPPKKRCHKMSSGHLRWSVSDVLFCLSRCLVGMPSDRLWQETVCVLEWWKWWCGTMWWNDVCLTSSS